MVDTVNQKFLSLVSYMIFSTAIGSFEWSLDFGPRSGTLTVRIILHEKKQVPKKNL